MLEDDRDLLHAQFSGYVTLSNEAEEILLEGMIADARCQGYSDLEKMLIHLLES